MPSYVAISRERHAGKTWLRYRDYAFAAAAHVVPLVAAELAKAALCLPIAFLREREAFVPMAVLSLEPGRNLFVSTDGRWLAPYVPSLFRSHPFALASADGGERMVLCIDEESGLVADEGGEPFFAEDGAVAAPSRAVLDFLMQVEANRAATRNSARVLAERGMLAPWPVTVRAHGGDRAVEGLFRIDETAIGNASAEDLVALRDGGALPVAYCQLLSMQHLPVLGKLAEAHDRLRTAEQQVIQEAFKGPGDQEIDVDWSVFSAPSGEVESSDGKDGR